MRQALTRASNELFRRTPDESLATLDDLWQNCQSQQERSRDLWEMPDDFEAFADGGRFALRIGEDRTFRLNSWSFGQLCGLAGVNRATVVLPDFPVPVQMREDDYINPSSVPRGERQCPLPIAPPPPTPVHSPHARRSRLNSIPGHLRRLARQAGQCAERAGRGTSAARI